MKHSIYPCLWFEGNAKEAAEYYCSIFRDAKIVSENPIVVQIQIGDRKFMLLNGRRGFEFNESVSFVIECDTQEEIDHYWNSLTKEGKENMCGWLKDKFGVSWQIVPSILGSLMSDPQRAQPVMNAFLKMKKFNIQALLDAK